MSLGGANHSGLHGTRGTRVMKKVKSRWLKIQCDTGHLRIQGDTEYLVGKNCAKEREMRGMRECLLTYGIPCSKI